MPSLVLVPWSTGTLASLLAEKSAAGCPVTSVPSSIGLNVTLVLLSW